MSGFISRAGLTCVIGVGGAYLLWNALMSRKRKSLLPHLYSWIPYLGQGPGYFASMAKFCHFNKEKLGGCFSATVFGREYVFIFEKEDVDALLRSSEKDASMMLAVSALAGMLFPHDDPNDLNTPLAKEKLTRGSSPTKWDAQGFAATATVRSVAHGLHPRILRAWIPNLRKVVASKMSVLPDSGEIDLFSWCKDLICEFTLFGLFGDAVPVQDKDVWIRLLVEADIEQAFRSPLQSLGTLFDVAVRGERRIYGQMRELMYPYLDDAIRHVLAGEPEPEDASYMRATVHFWHEQGDGSAAFLRSAGRRIANDAIFFAFAAIANSFSSAAWVLFHVVRNTSGCGDRVATELASLSSVSDVLPELEHTIYEVSRLYNPATNVPRMLTRPWRIPSAHVTLPAGTMVAVPLYDIHRDPTVYADPLKFDPQRFQVAPGRDERAKAGTMYLGFGAGSHPCLGRRFAVMEVALFVSEALRQFEWELMGDSERPEDPFTQSSIDVPRHPTLDPAQTSSIWRPLEPVSARYRRRAAA